MEYFKIKGFDEFQHYKTRTPPWIKLYATLLSDIKFNAMTDSQQITLIKLWVLSSQNGNQLAYDSQLIRRQLASNSRISLDFFVKSGWIEIYTDSQDIASIPLEPNKETYKQEIEKEEEYINGGKFEFTILDLDYARVMREDIKTFKPDFYFAETEENWAGELCFLRRARKISPHHILEVWDFARADDFWRGIILAPWNLTKNFDKLEIAMSKQKVDNDSWAKFKHGSQDETERQEA